MAQAVRKFILSRGKNIPRSGISWAIVPYIVPKEHYDAFVKGVAKYASEVSISMPQAEVSLDGKRLRIYSLGFAQPAPVTAGPE